MIYDASFWAALSFVLFVALIYKPVARMLGKGLDGRSERIQTELDEALKLKEEAQAILANYQRDQRAASEEIDAIMKRAKEEAKRIADQAQEKLEHEIQRRIDMAEQKISQAEVDVINELRDNAVDITSSAARSLILENLNKDLTEDIIADAITGLDRKLH